MNFHRPYINAPHTRNKPAYTQNGNLAWKWVLSVYFSNSGISA